MQLNKNSKILGVFAHREDFICMGWPIYQNKNFQRHLIVCTDDGIIPIKEVCSHENINFVGSCHLPNGFIRKNQTVKAHEVIFSVLSKAISEIDPDYILTHNPWGEYGHIDHRFLFELVYNNFSKCNLLISDIKVISSYYPPPPVDICRLFQSLYLGNNFLVKPDLDFYIRNAAIFNKYELWTTNANLNLYKYPVESQIFLIPKRSF